MLPHLQTVDLVLTDPPYGHGDLWQGGTWGAAEMYKDARRWDSEPIEQSTIAAMIAAGAYAIVWGGNYYIMQPSRCWLAWLKSSRMATLADFELAWTNFDRPAKSIAEDRNPDGKRMHPTQKPLSVMKWCLAFAAEAKTVLDPFAGSGTTLVAAKALDRKAIGIEIEERYCEIAANRLRQEVFQFTE